MATVEVGTPITTEQATRAVLRMVTSPLVGLVDDAESPWQTIDRVKRQGNGRVYEALSHGEKILVDVADAIWQGRSDAGASIGAIGGLDRATRRRVLVVLTYLHLGYDSHDELEASRTLFANLFADARPSDVDDDRGVWEDCRAERARAHVKHGATSMESTGADDPTGRRYRVLLEEVGEVAKEFNEAEHDGRPVDLALLRKELIQVAAMAGAWADACAPTEVGH